MDATWLDEVSQALRGLHQELVAAAQVDYEKVHGRVAGPGALLQLVLDHPSFAWLRPMSALIAQIDEWLDEAGGAGPEKRSAVRASLARLRADPRYLALLQSDPGVVMAHAKLLAKEERTS